MSMAVFGSQGYRVQENKNREIERPPWLVVAAAGCELLKLLQDGLLDRLQNLTAVDGVKLSYYHPWDRDSITQRIRPVSTQRLHFQSIVASDPS